GIGVTGVWTFSSKAVFSRSNVRSIMEMVQTTTGKLAGVPFFLRVEMQESTISGNPNKFPVVSIDCAMDLEDLMKQNLQLGEPEKVKKLDPSITDNEQKQEKTEQKAKFTPLVQAKYDEIDKYLNENKDKMDSAVYKARIEWLNNLKDPTVKFLIESLSKLKEKTEPTGEYQQYHESLITACCDTLKTKDRLPVIQTLNILVRKWKIDGKEKLKDCTENECLNLLEAFDKQLKDDDEQDLPY
ncbi:hypothetical protein LCGC14_2983430, partial [marine sediment metagenome]